MWEAVAVIFEADYLKQDCCRTKHGCDEPYRHSSIKTRMRVLLKPEVVCVKNFDVCTKKKASVTRFSGRDPQFSKTLPEIDEQLTSVRNQQC